jgi:trk system potassium uptake protein TrkA
VNIVIIGCGRVGGFLAGLLDAEGHRVSVIDIASDSAPRAERAWFQHLPAEFKGETIHGDGTDQEVLRQAGIERADAVVALTEGDNRNLMAAQIAKRIFGVKRVIAKVNDPVRARMYRRMGIDTFSRTTILGTLLFAMLMDDREVGEVLIQKSLQHEDELAGEPVAVKAL